ncbi:porin family protein [Photobacterium sp. SDRW27]|uniref:porin family protein n=1 Tax=Photobacterium obscurum TaxID=2829490 RepID=UPI00224487D3|nr:porin family protein [Photobacterium obscurum]MCW8328786.1 porin family protein [Photobacterium obscurum]
MFFKLCMKKLIPLLLLTCSTSCFAVDHHVALRLGGGSISNDDHADAGFAFQLGYNYLFTPYLALDTAYYANSGGLGYVGSLGFLDEISSIEGGLLGAKAQYPVLPFLTLFARAGVNYSSVEVTSEIRKEEDITKRYSGVNPYYGAGTEITFGQHVGITIEYQRIELSHNFSSDNWLTGVNIKF